MEIEAVLYEHFWMRRPTNLSTAFATSRQFFAV